jgi:hypothetical protein
MIQQVNAPPLEFERTVREVVTDALGSYGFHLDADAPSLNTFVSFVRRRQGQWEKINFGRAWHDEKSMTNPNEEDEVDLCQEDEQGKFWPSRHFLYIQHYVNYGGANLFPNGKISHSLAQEHHWRFIDEADLARRLRDEALPMILDASLKWFDVALDDEIDLMERGLSTGYRPPDAA